MKHIILVFSYDITSRQTALQCVQRIALSKEYNSACAKASTFIKIVTDTQDTDKLLDKAHSTNDWLSVEETISVLTRIEKQENPEECYVGSVSSQMENLATALHDVADTLPYLGSSIDIILCMGCPGGVAADSGSVMSVSGALRRLFDWHNGCAVVVKLRQEMSPLERHLAEFAHCQVVDSVDKLNLTWPGWRGKVAVMDHIENKGHVFPAIWLEGHDWDSLFHQKLVCTQQTQTSTDRHSVAGVSSSHTAVCGRTAEVLQEVDLRTFPLCLLDSWTLHLHAAERHSEILVKYIQDMHQTGLLARVRVYPDVSKIPVCGSMNLSTAAWKERVVSDVENMQEPTEEQVTDDWLFVYFLLLPSRTSSQLSVVAQVLLSPHEISTSILPIVEAQFLVQKSVIRRNRNRCRDEIAACDELVIDQRDRFEMILKLLQENLKHVLAECQDDVSQGSDAYQNIMHEGADIQGHVISAAFHQCKSIQESWLDSTGYSIKWFAESALDPSKFPEKLAMQATEATRKMLQSFPSMDSLTTSSPLSVAEVDKKKNSVDFNVSDIFEYFNHDGTMKEMPICSAESVRLKGRGLCRMDSCSSSKLQWPESTVLKYHGIFYYNSEINWSLEKRYSKVRDRGYFQDTRSSFVSPVKKTQETHSMLRRSASAQSSVTDSRPERPRRMSPRKLSVADIFKQPASHVCSPRKQSQGTLSATTPELPLFSLSNSLGQQSLSDLRAHSADLPKRSRENFSRNRAKDQTPPSAVGNSRQSQRKRSLTPSDPRIACKRDRKLPAFASHDVVDLSCPVRRSPRRPGRPLRINSDSSVSICRLEKLDTSMGGCDGVRNTSFKRQMTDASLENSSSEQASAKMKRSERHKLKLERIIDHVLREKGIQDKDKIYSACSRNLFNVSMVLLKTLTTSQNLTEEMKTVVYGQVTQIINLEKRRCGMAL